MECRPAKTEDLPQLKAVYGRIIARMNEQNICIWDEVYPCEFFREDIEQGRLYLKNGFRRVGGVYDEVIDEDLVLRELGLEKKLDDMQR